MGMTFLTRRSLFKGPAGFSALCWFERVKRAFGPEQVEADKQRELVEQGRKRPRRSLDQEGR